MKPRFISVVGFKDSGKTRVIETIIRELTSRGKTVATIKHTSEDVILDTPGKDTWRHRQAGAQSSAILHNNGSAIFLEGSQPIWDVVTKLGNPDYIILEGFKHLETLPRIIVLKTPEDFKQLSNGLEIAVIETYSPNLIHDSTPIIRLGDSGRLADLIEEKAFPMLSGLDCGRCGYQRCKELALAILKGTAEISECVMQMCGVRLIVNSKDIPLNRFTREILHNILIGILKTLKGTENPNNIELVIKDE